MGVFVTMVNFLRQCRLERSLASEKVANGEGRPGMAWTVPLPRVEDAQKREALLNTLRHFGVDRFLQDGAICGTAEGATLGTSGNEERLKETLKETSQFNGEKLPDVPNKSTSSAPKPSTVRGSLPKHGSGGAAGTRQPSPPRQRAMPKRRDNNPARETGATSKK